MTEDKNDTRNSAIAAAIILVVAGLAFYFMPQIVIGIGQFSPVLGAVAGGIIICGFFIIFWLRSRFKK